MKHTLKIANDEASQPKTLICLSVIKSPKNKFVYYTPLMRFVKNYLFKNSTAN